MNSWAQCKNYNLETCQLFFSRVCHQHLSRDQAKIIKDLNNLEYPNQSQGYNNPKCWEHQLKEKKNENAFNGLKTKIPTRSKFRLDRTGKATNFLVRHSSRQTATCLEPRSDETYLFKVQLLGPEKKRKQSSFFWWYTIRTSNTSTINTYFVL